MNKYVVSPNECKENRGIIVKGMTNMRNTIEKYIDNCLIDDYADKDLICGYSLDVCSISEHDRYNFLDVLLKNDPILKDLVLDRMQELIDSRLSRIEVQHKYDAGLNPVHDSINGEVRWI